MKRALLLIAFAAGVLSAAAPGQAPAAVQVAPAIETCLPSTTLDELVKALGQAISGPADKDRTCLRALLMPDARLVPVSKAADGSYVPHALTVDGWIERVKKRGSAAFYEVQVKVKPEVYGHIAHLWSTYEIRETPDGKAQVRGINSIQAVNDGTRWRVYQVFWQAETPDELVPERYLP